MRAATSPHAVDATMSLALRLLDGVEETAHTTSTPSTRATMTNVCTVQLELPRLAELPPSVQIIVVAARADHRRRVAEALAVPTQWSWGSSTLRDGQELQSSCSNGVYRTLYFNTSQPVVLVLGRWW